MFKRNEFRAPLIAAWLCALALLAAVVSHAADGWKAGVAKTVITPRTAMWMSGYANRTRPAEGTEHELWAKALALEDANGRRAVLVTLDLVGIDRATSLKLRAALKRTHGLEPAQVALNCSHTHCGPVVGRNLEGMFFFDERQWKVVEDYTAGLEKEVLRVVGEALHRLAPCTLTWGEGTADIAVNRRANKHDRVQELRQQKLLQGPVDHSVPVLRVNDAHGRALAIVVGYACHPTKLTDFYRWCGDYAGFAQLQLEKQHPGAVALFWQGCSGDLVPWPRGGGDVRQAEETGARLADAVKKVLAGSLTAIAGDLATQFAEVELPLAELPERKKLEERMQSSNRTEARWARRILDQLDRGQPPALSYPYPIQVWRLGSELTFVLLGGEVVVDYALRLKREFAPRRLWVAGCTGDVMAYIPSRRVLAEGGYEGGDAMIYYGLPSVWRPEVEEVIVSNVHQLARDVGITRQR